MLPDRLSVSQFQYRNFNSSLLLDSRKIVNTVLDLLLNDVVTICITRDEQRLFDIEDMLIVDENFKAPTISIMNDLLQNISNDITLRYPK